MPRATPDMLTRAARYIALEASVNAGRLTPALHALADAEGFLKSATGGGITGGSISDPTGRTVEARRADHATADRNRIETILDTMQKLTAELSQIVGAWAPDERQQARLRAEVGGAAITNDEIWCTNCASHGIDNPRKPGRSLCDFCIDFRGREDNPRSFLPGRWLLDVRSRRRLNSADIAKHIADLTSEWEAERTAKKAEKAAAKAATKTPHSANPVTSGGAVLPSATDMDGGPVESVTS